MVVLFVVGVFAYQYYTSDKGDEVIAKLETGIAHMERNNWVGAVAIFKEIVADEQAPAKERSLAVFHTLNIYQANPHPDFADVYIFTGEGWEDIKEGDTREEIEHTLLRGYEWANELAPRHEVHYAIASVYGNVLFAASLTAEQRRNNLALFVKHVQAGDALFLSALENPQFTNVERAASYITRGDMYALYYFIDSYNEEWKNITEDSFKEAIRLYGVLSLAKETRARQQYALFLQELTFRNIEDRTEDIEALMGSASIL